MHSTFPTSPDRAANVTPLRPNASLAKAGLAGVSAAARAKPYDGYDVLTETLRQVRLTGSVFLNANFTKPFGVISPERFSAEAPMADLRHVSIFHLIASGSWEI